MILGIGSDVIKIARINHVYNTYGDKFILRILHQEEIHILHAINYSKKVHFLAKRWAAKEALVKALGTGIRDPFYMNHISLAKHNSGKPYFKFNLPLQSLMLKLNIQGIHVSISDDSDYAFACVIIETK